MRQPGPELFFCEQGYFIEINWKNCIAFAVYINNKTKFRWKLFVLIALFCLPGIMRQ